MTLSDAYLTYLAKGVTMETAMIDDLVQEGRIKCWKMEEGHPRQYYVVAVKRRMVSLLSGNEAFTGATGTRGYKDAMSRKAPHAPLDSMLADPAFDEGRLRQTVARSRVLRNREL